MERRIAQYITENNLFDASMNIGIALSGGIDSMVLLDVLRKLGYKVSAFHYEHGIRGDQSIADAAFVADYCQKSGVACFIGMGDVPEYAEMEGLSIETAARIKRYEFFDACNCDVIAVAHHADDQAETILQHIIRGSGIKGLLGMLPKNGKIVRPMLCVNRAEIEKYACDNNISYKKDSTNDDIAYTRNRIRLEILPLLKEINPRVVDAFSRLSDSARSALEIIEKESALINIDVHDGMASADFDLIRKAPATVAQYVIYKMFCMVGQEVDIEASHVNEILSLKRSGSYKIIKNGYYAKNEYGKLIISNKQLTIKNKYCVSFDHGARLPEGLIEITDEKFNPKNTDRFNECFSDIPEGSVVRQRLPGDVFHPFGGKKKKLADYMTDAKIPRDVRDNIPLLAYGNEIIWVVGYAISADYAVKNNHYISLKFTWRK